jgi:hypothetical protein
VDDDTTPDEQPAEPTRAVPTAPAPRASQQPATQPRTATRTAPDREADDDETQEFGGGFRLGDPRPSVADMPPPLEREDAPAPTNIYRARRPAAAVMLVVPAVLFGLLLAHALAVSAFGEKFSIQGTISSSLALASLPLVVAGLYGLITGAAYGAEQWGFKVWAKPPLAYLLVGLALLTIAGLAIR